MKITKDARITDAQIEALEKLGYKRWTKYGKDRLYATEACIGLEIEGQGRRVFYSALDGKEISHASANRLSIGVSNAYIDIETGRFYGFSDDAYELAVAKIEEIAEEGEAEEVEAEEAEAESEEVEAEEVRTEEAEEDAEAKAEKDMESAIRREAAELFAEGRYRSLPAALRAVRSRYYSDLQ